jgi:signal transduction histidine kinase
MRLSVQAIVGIIVVLLVFASGVAVYFAVGRELTIPLLLVAIANLEAVIILVFLITRGVVNPLGRIQKIIEQVGQGDFTVRIGLEKHTKEIRELAQSLNKMIVRLEASHIREKRIEQLKSEFVSLAAHQLRTPLSAVKWTLRMLQEGDMGKLNTKQQEMIEKTIVSNERMIHLINDLLNVARIEEGRTIADPVAGSIIKLLSQVTERYQTEASRRNIQLVFEMPSEDVPLVRMDKERMQLVFESLVENALLYTPEQGQVTLKVQYGKKEVEVFVQDTGIGIPALQQERVFEKFFRASNARKKETEGTGLGLYLAQNIVKAHTGTLSFTSQEDKGTTFIATLPVAA